MSTALGQLTAGLSDRYRIERELGQGGMATVCLAEDLKHHRQVAIKVLRPDLAAAGEWTATLERAAGVPLPALRLRW